MFYHPTLIQLQADAHVLELRQSAAAGVIARRFRRLPRQVERATPTAPRRGHARELPAASPGGSGGA